MMKKLIIDCDPGIDDAIALSLGLLAPELEVLAVTSVEGSCSSEQVTRNIQAVVEYLDPPRIPRIGSAMPSAISRPSNLAGFHGPDGLGGCSPEVSRLHQEHPSDKVICDLVRSAPEQVTILALGPLSNLARAFRRDPELPNLIGRVVIMGGSVTGVGNVTPCAEFNVHFDPESARDVFQSPTTKTLIPLEVTSRPMFTVDVLQHVPPRTLRLGEFLQRLLSFSVRTHRQFLGLEGIYLHAAVAMMAVLHPELFEATEMHGDVECRGELTLGATVFDRRPMPHTRPNMEVVRHVNEEAVRESILRALRRTGQR